MNTRPDSAAPVLDMAWAIPKSSAPPSGFTCIMSGRATMMGTVMDSCGRRKGEFTGLGDTVGGEDTGGRTRGKIHGEKGERNSCVDRLESDL